MTLDRKATGKLALVGVPDPPRGLLKVTKDEWIVFHNSPQARLLVPADLPALTRLFRLRDDRERARRGLRGEGIVRDGARPGSLVIHPLARYLRNLDADILALEGHFGLTPRSRLQLGIALVHARDGLSDLHRDLEADDG